MDSFWRFTRKMLRTHRGGLALAMVFAFISAGGLMGGLLSLAPMLKIILNPGDGRSLVDLALEFNARPEVWLRIPQGIVDRLPTDPFRGVLLIITGVVILTVLAAIANFLHQYLSQTITTKVIACIRRDAFDTVLHMPLGRVVQRGPSEFVARIVRDAAELQRGLIALVSKSVTQITKGAAAFIVAVYFDWRLTLIAVIVVPILAVVLRKIGKRIRRGTRGSLKAQEGLLRVATESLQGLRAVKANTAESTSKRRFDDENERVVHHELRIRTARALSAPLVEALAVVGICVLALVAAKSILNESLPLEQFLLTLGCLGFAGGAFRPLAGLVNEMQAAAAPAGRLVDILSEPIEMLDGRSRVELPAHRRSIEFHSVTFSYPPTGANAGGGPVLDGISLRIDHAHRVAVVGPNGSGKTTLVSLLPRLLVPDSGRILIDGVDISEVSLLSLRRQIGVVTQETVLIRGTVAENIAFGLDDASRDQIIEAAKRARAHSFIEQLPGGYEADLAEQGASLSGGQRQRLAIARAILRDPSILILDEATSQIDSESETQINEALTEFCAGRTALVVAHRLATVLNADRIVVMDAGRVVDQGTHDELLSRCELYCRLTEGQLIAAG
ncbi:MAG: ABC transporter ATP-binding protein [Phycisphaerales bacterium]|nr:MAG: ABC transporter ATP-binding protein [Phycisphaerales bacterium]